MQTILFVCVENAGRSQMAEAFAKKYGREKVIALSAGNKPAEHVNAVVIEVMNEKGIDLSQNNPKLISAKMAIEADLIVTMGCDDQGVCPGHSLNRQSSGTLKIQKANPQRKSGTSGMK
jgi:arsenate reductase (thioredoxin)